MQSILGFQGGASRIKCHKAATWKIKGVAHKISMRVKLSLFASWLRKRWQWEIMKIIVISGGGQGKMPEWKTCEN